MRCIHISSGNYLQNSICHLPLTSRTVLNASHLITPDFLAAYNKTLRGLIKARDAIRHTREARLAAINNILVSQEENENAARTILFVDTYELFPHKRA